MARFASFFSFFNSFLRLRDSESREVDGAGRREERLIDASALRTMGFGRSTMDGVEAAVEEEDSVCEVVNFEIVDGAEDC